MKKIGVVGGVSWLSTIEYYKIICELSHRNQPKNRVPGPPVIPEMVIESLNINKSFNMRGTNDNPDSWQPFEAYFRAALMRLESSGAEVAFIASNTPHNRFEEITKGISIPVISIFEATGQKCLALGVDEVMILGTAPTMASSVFSSVLTTLGIRSFVPESDQDKSSIVTLIDQVQAGETISDERTIQTVVHNAAKQFSGGRAAVCLSCTELPLLFPEHVDEPSFEVDDILYVNTTVVHAMAVFAFASGY